MLFIGSQLAWFQCELQITVLDFLLPQVASSDRFLFCSFFLPVSLGPRRKWAKPTSPALKLKKRYKNTCNVFNKSFPLKYPVLGTLNFIHKTQCTYTKPSKSPWFILPSKPKKARYFPAKRCCWTCRNYFCLKEHFHEFI